MPHDVFISYAHADDVKPSDTEAGWVTTFVEELKTVLRMKMGNPGPDVWMDHLLDVNAQVTPTLQDKIKSSRTIVLFMSPSYLSSDWCKREIGQFLDDNRAHKNQESVFIVAVEDTAREKWHQRLQELTPLQLYTKSLSGTPYRLGYPRPPNDGNSEYWKNLNELAHLITKHLQLLSQASLQVERPAASSTLLTGSAQSQNIPIVTNVSKIPTVWIAQPTEDLYDQWESLASAIRQQGANILPLGRSIYPLSSIDDFRRAVDNDLVVADLLVQLLSATPGNTIAGGPANTNSLQSLLAKTHCETVASVAFLQWRSSDIMLDAISDNKCRELLQGTIASGFTQFSRLVLEALAPLLRPATIATASTQSGDSLSLCITAGPKDSALCDDIADIIDSLGHTPYPVPPAPESNQTPEKYRTEFETLLGNVNGVILAHSHESGMWLQSRHAQVRKIFAQRGQKIWGAFVDGPPPEKTKIRCSGPGLIQLDCKNGLKREPIQRFIEALLSERVHV